MAIVRSFLLDLFNSTFLTDFLAEAFCDLIFSAWGTIRVSSSRAQLQPHPTFIEIRCSYDGMEDKRIMGMQLDKPSSALYVAFSTCVIKVPLGRCERHGKCKKYVFGGGCQRPGHWASCSTPECHFVLFSPKGLHSIQGPILRMGEGERGVHTAGPWLQVSKGSGWKGCEALAVVPGSLGQSYLKHEAFREGKSVGSVCFYLISIHLRNVTNFFDVNSQLIGNC